MNVLQLVNEGLAGGVLKVAIKQSESLERLGHKTFLITGFNIPYQDEFFGERNFTFNTKINIPLPRYILNYSGNLLAQFTGVIGKLKLPSGFKPDWIICHNLGPIYDAIKLKNTYNCNLAVMIHNPTIPPPYGFPHLSKMLFNSVIHDKSYDILKNVDILLTTSENLRSYINQIYKRNPTIIYPGCDPLPKLPSSRGNYVLCVQRLSIGKETGKVAKAIASVDRNVRVVFAGSMHWTTRKVLKDIKESGLKNYRIFTNVPWNILEELYTHCRFFISMTREVFFLPLLEAASHGAPIIATADVGASKLFSHGIQGFFFEGNEYVEYIKELLHDERKAWRMGYEAWKLCREKYTWTIHAKKLVDLLESVS